MTISSTTNTVSYSGNGSTTAFAVPYVFFGTGTTSEIQVVEVVIATGAETVKTNGSDYTVSGGSGATGTVTAAVAPASTIKWVINRTTTQTQETDYVENDPFPAESHEEALDRLTAIAQEEQRALDRAAQLPDGYTGSFDPTLPTAITGSTVLAFNSAATAFEVGPTTAAISGAAAAATAAASSATASASSATASASSATASASSATAAAASATSIGLTTRGDLLKRGASANERLAIGSANKVLTTNGTDPAWGQVSLTAGVTGTLPLANGGTGATSLSGAGIAVLGANTFTGTQSLADAGSISISTPLLAGADHTFTGLSAQMLAGGAISAFDLVCIHTVTQEVVEADASAYATARVIGIAPAAISDTATGTVLLQGFIRDDTWTWTAGSTLYLSETAGAMTHTAPSTDGAFVLVVGVALSPDVVYINPSMDVIEHA